ncbi:10113_t:CDS:2 [Ambispora leptoticha]|uniref:10113_t:CDS:1 n=1 Tax=Ambispora leptoticha TaxID=144679 RepID=A0A9N9AF69_9GLOM|nr:10113_t:CDS:2 [Ambispora leptoticha]
MNKGKNGYAMPNVIVHFPPEVTPSELIQKTSGNHTTTTLRINPRVLEERARNTYEKNIIALRKKLKSFYPNMHGTKFEFKRILILKIASNTKTKNNTVQQFLENDFYEGTSKSASHNGSMIDAATHSPFPLEKNTLMPYPSLFSCEYNLINESSSDITFLNFHTS